MTKASAQGARDEYYGHEHVSKACSRFLTFELGLDDQPPMPAALSSVDKPLPSPPLDKFIAYALARTQYHPHILFAALFYLNRARPKVGAPAHKLLTAGFILAAKACSDDIYALSAWAKGISRGLFAPTKLFAAELALCVQLRWRLHLPQGELRDFEQRVRAQSVVEWPLEVSHSAARALIRRGHLAKKARAVAAANAERTRQRAGYSTSPISRRRSRTILAGPSPRVPDSDFAHHLHRLEDLVAEKYDAAADIDIDHDMTRPMTALGRRTSTVLTPPDSPTPTPTPRADRWLSQRHYAQRVQS